MGAFFTREGFEKTPDLGDPDYLMRKIFVLRRVGFPLDKKKIRVLSVHLKRCCQCKGQASAAGNNADPH